MTAPNRGPRLVTRGIDDRSLGFLIAGASTIAARSLLSAIRNQPPASGSRDVAGAWVAAIYSHNDRRARQFAETHGVIHAGDDLPALLRRPEIQCVYVGNQPRHHAESVLAALEAHKHVLCEPPLALTLDEAETLHQMAENRGLVLAMDYSWRASDAIHHLHEAVLEDTIGELLGGRIQNTVYLPPEQHTWRIQENGGGVIWDRTLHDLDLVQYLVHRPVREVYARNTLNLLAAEVEDDIVGYVVTTGGLVVQLYDSFVLPHVPTTVELFGANGTLTARHCAPSAGEANSGSHVGSRRWRLRCRRLTPTVPRWRVCGGRAWLGATAGDQRRRAAQSGCRCCAAHGALAQGQPVKVDRAASSRCAMPRQTTLALRKD